MEPEEEAEEEQHPDQDRIRNATSMNLPSASSFSDSDSARKVIPQMLQPNHEILSLSLTGDDLVEGTREEEKTGRQDACDEYLHQLQEEGEEDEERERGEVTLSSGVSPAVSGDECVAQGAGWYRSDTRGEVRAEGMGGSALARDGDGVGGVARDEDAAGGGVTLWGGDAIIFRRRRK